MNLTDNLLGEAWYWAAWAVWLPILARVVWVAPWRRLRDPELLNVWLGMVVLLILIWSMKAGVKPGLGLHLLGATVFTLCFGPALAFIGLCLVILGITLNGAAGTHALALNALLLAGSGVLMTEGMRYVFTRLLPCHFFVFVFVNAFFGAALTILGVGVVVCLFLSLVGAYEWSYLSTEFLPYFLLLAFSEAWLSGTIMTLFVVYRPKWVVSFDDSRYLSGK